MASREKASTFKDENSFRIFTRNMPTLNLDPYLSFSPMSTKYNKNENYLTKRQTDLNENLLEYKTSYIPNMIFDPDIVPWKGYRENVNKESVLRNQVYALQKCNQSEYVPSNNSDLYDYSLHVKQINMSHPLLFNEEEFSEVNPNDKTKMVGNEIFNNHTRNQLRRV